MKASKETVNRLALDFKAIMESFDTARQAYIDGLSEVARSWQIYDYICLNRLYDDKHPCWAKGLWGKRILPHDPSFQTYPDDTNDNTLTTALRAAYKRAEEMDSEHNINLNSDER